MLKFLIELWVEKTKIQQRGEAMLDEIVKKALEKNSHDIHIKVNSPVKIRVLGELIPLDSRILTADEVESILTTMLSPEDWKKLNEELDLDFAYETKNYRLRVNAFRQQEEWAAIMRIIPPKIPTFEELGLPPIVKEIALKPKGIILITGPASCGKTTTIASMIEFINQNVNTHIITLEQPIEYKFKNRKALIDQREVGKDTESFLTGLRYALRQDPDIVMVGEMRDLETISTAITTAETGHLVLSTLHTSSAIGTITRIINSFPPHQRDEIRTQISLSIQGIVSQVLIPRADKSGMIAVFEILYPTYGVRNLIRTNNISQIESILQTDKNCTTLRKEVQKLIAKGIITEEDARKYVKFET